MERPWNPKRTGMPRFSARTKGLPHRSTRGTIRSQIRWSTLSPSAVATRLLRGHIRALTEAIAATFRTTAPAYRRSLRKSVTSLATPEVSVCVPVYNAERWIARALASVLAQTHTSFEVVVVDDASTDGTLRRLKEVHDPRVRVYSNVRNLGHSGNWNRTLSLTRGRLIKFLCADDVLYEDCIETMVELFREHPALGLVFSLRDVERETPDDRVAIEWEAKHRNAHAVFGELRSANSGPALARLWLDSGLPRNAVGEPTNVMVTRDCLRRIGTFGLRLRQRADMDLWLRAMFFFDVGFVDRPLARYLIRSSSLTSVNRAGGLAWMDGLWMLEGLLSYREIREGWPQVRALRRRATWSTVRHAMRGAAVGDRDKLRALREYAGVRLLGAEPKSLYGSLDDPAPPGETVEYPSAASRLDRA
jgi:glycosyltransferase involved in cell wall biosynthesis